MADTLIVLNDPPYGSERSYNGLRLALALAKADPGGRVRVFLFADAVFCAKSGQTTPDGYYNLERMLHGALRRGEVLACGSCMDARGLADGDLIEGARRSSMDELAQGTLEAGRVLVF